MPAKAITRKSTKAGAAMIRTSLSLHPATAHSACKVLFTLLMLFVYFRGNVAVCLFTPMYLSDYNAIPSWNHIGQEIQKGFSETNGIGGNGDGISHSEHKTN